MSMTNSDYFKFLFIYQNVGKITNKSSEVLNRLLSTSEIKPMILSNQMTLKDFFLDKTKHIVDFSFLFEESKLNLNHVQQAEDLWNLHFNRGNS